MAGSSGSMGSGNSISANDSASSSASFSQGAKNSSLNLAAPLSTGTPSWLMARLSGNADSTDHADNMTWAVAAIAGTLAAVMLYMKQGR